MFTLLLACAEPEASDPDTVDPATWDALWTPRDDLPDRTRGTDDAQPRFTPSGEPVHAVERWGQTPDLVVVDTSDDGAVRYRWSDRDLDLLFWLQEEDLVEVLAVDGWIAADGHLVEEGASGVWTSPGRVPTSDGTLEVSVWNVEVHTPVTSALLDRVWTAAMPPGPGTGDPVYLDPGAVVDDDDAVLAEVHSQVEARLLEREAGRGLVEVRITPACTSFTSVVRGWVRLDRTTPGGWGQDEGSYCCGFGRFHFPRGGEWTAGLSGVVAEDTWIYDAPGGAVIGRATADTVVSVFGEEAEVDGQRAVEVHTGFGYTMVWMAVTDWDVSAFVESGG